MLQHFQYFADGKVLLALGAAAVVNILVGMVWYHPQVFGNLWMRLSGHSQGVKSPQLISALLGKFVAAFVMAAVMACFLSRLGHLGSWQSGLLFGAMSWLGFAATTEVDSVLFGGKSWSLFLLCTSCDLVGMSLMGVVLALLLPR